jgi:hypothetical protein
VSSWRGSSVLNSITSAFSGGGRVTPAGSGDTTPLVVLRIGACRFSIKRCHQHLVTESFTLHAPACQLVLIAAPTLTTTAGLSAIAAWLHPLLRLGYISAYVANVPPLRSLCWASAILCSGLLYSAGLQAVLAG